MSPCRFDTDLEISNRFPEDFKGIERSEGYQQAQQEQNLTATAMLLVTNRLVF